MRAAVCTRYGPPEMLHLQDVGKPAPRDNEVLIKIRATAVTSTDCFVRSALRFASIQKGNVVVTVSHEAG